MRLKHLTGFHYPKITIFILMIFVAYLIFRNDVIASFILGLGNLRYIGIFFAGVIFSFGFTALIAAGFFISYTPQNIFLASIVAALGVVLSNMLMIKFIKISLEDEIVNLESTRMFKFVNSLIEKEIGHRFKMYLMYAFAGIVIASPLPDELAMTILAGFEKVNHYFIALISFVLSVIGILILLAL